MGELANKMINLQFIIFIIKLYLMIAQKRFFRKARNENQPKVIRYVEEGQNIGNFDSFQSNKLMLSARGRSVRPQLAQITTNTDQLAKSQFLFSKDPQSALHGDYKCQFLSLESSLDNSNAKQSELFINDNMQLNSSCIEGKRPPRLIHERPKTSMSLQFKNKDVCQVKKWNVMLEQALVPEDERISTSRALSKYSQVQRNKSSSRFKVKKDKSLTPPYLSARKIVLQIKQKKENYSRQTLRDSIINNGMRRYSMNGKWTQAEQFQLKGWDYE